ncbi:protein of unknown function [Moritella yayanosii]|uniref:Uncharacterized protein n=1 Tax=Moritella yayanosii TaxID=69539 RepID=A0A330LUD0_9GAMM|nr:protein of unknown function [Moritella yayanosii]
MIGYSVFLYLFHDIARVGLRIALLYVKVEVNTLFCFKLLIVIVLSVTA